MDNKLRLRLIIRNAYDAIKAQKSVLSFNSRHTLKALCMHKILTNQEFFEDLARYTPDRNPLLRLPPSVLDSMREEIINNVDLRVDCDFFSVLIHLATTSVRFGWCQTHSGGGDQDQCHEKKFWEALEHLPNLKQLRFFDGPPCDIHERIFKFEHLQVVDVPCLECDDSTLVQFATQFPNLQELSVKLLAVDVYEEGAEALSELKNFKIFNFFMDGWGTNSESLPYMILSFIALCLQLMPKLLKLGYKINSHPSWYYHHPLQVLREDTEINLESLVLKGKNLKVPGCCSLPNLKELFLYDPQGDFNVFMKFTRLVHLYITDCNSFDTVEKILKLVGAQLTSLHLRCIVGICLETVFSLCPNVEKLTIEAIMANQNFLSPVALPKLAEFKIDASGNDCLVIQSSAFREIIKSPNLKHLALVNVSFHNEDASHLAQLVQKKEILQNIEKIALYNEDFSDGGLPTENDVYVIQFLTQCAISCPKLASIICKNGTYPDSIDIFHAYLNEAVTIGKCEP